MRLDQLTFTRFLAAISIVIYHYGKNIFPFNLEICSFLFRQANVGVSYFFILSGFVMIIAYGRKDKIAFGNYLKRRFARIYPVYFLAIITLFIYLFLTGKHVDYKGLIFNLALIQSWIPGYALSFNDPGWSLAVELFFYLAFPLLFNLFYRKRSLKQLIIPIIIIFIGSQVLFHYLSYSNFYAGFPSKSHDFIHYFPLMHLNEFLIGNIAGLFFINGLKKRNYDLPIIVVVVLVSFLLKFNGKVNFHNGMLAFAFVPLILMFSANNGLLTKILNNKIFVFCGEISYGIYILQKPVYMWVNGALQSFNITNTTLIFYTTLIVLVIFSALSYKFFEAPLRKKINKIRIASNANLAENLELKVNA